MKKLLLTIAAAAILSAIADAQNPAAKTRTNAAPSKAIIFAVMNDGKTLEPLAMINGKKLEPAEASTEATSIQAFGRKYYKKGTAYNLIFGGSTVGKATVISNDPSSECAKNLADVSLSSVKPNIKGLVMAFATNAAVKTSPPGIRRMPTPAERASVERLVRGEYQAQKVSSSSLEKLRYHNLTALDVDRDGKPEFVGSYWVEPSANRRDLLFFVAESRVDGTLKLTHKDYAKVSPKDVMSGDLKDLDSGIGGELLLDVFDYDGDGTGEIFTVGRAFEGNNFYVYKRDGGSWKRVFESYNYHCAY